jgi:hypothetical protein
MNGTRLRIDRGISLPRHSGEYYKYPWGDLNIGDSFFVERARITTLSSLALRAGRRLSKRFTCRSLVEDGVPGVRVFRIE